MKRVKLICKGSIDALESAINNWLYNNECDKIFFQFSQSIGTDGEGYFSVMIIYET